MRKHTARFSSCLVGVFAGLPIALGPDPLVAGPIESFWNDPVGGAFLDPANWDGPVPDETVTAIFDLDADPLVLFEEDALSDRLIVRKGHVTLRLVEVIGGEFGPLSYESLNPLFSTPSIVVGENSGESAELVIQSGLLSGKFTVIGLMPGSAGTVQFSTFLGVVPVLMNEFHLHVGNQGQGVLTISNAVTVINDVAVLGVLGGSSGQATVTGDGSLWECSGTLSVGKQGQGALTISDEGTMISAGALIGQQVGSIGEVTVTGLGSTWTINGPLDVGFEGQGSLTISDGGAVFTNSFATIGTIPEANFPAKDGGTGDVTISGPASFWIINGDLHVAFLWLGTLNVLDGAAVISDNGFVGMAFNPVGESQVRGANSTWSNVGNLTVWSKLTVAEGALVAADLIEIEAEAELNGDGTVQGELTNAGLLRPGDPIGTLTIDGNLTHTGVGELVIELASANISGFDTLHVIGQAKLPGTLTVVLADAFAPQAGDSFTILTAGAIIAPFGPIKLPNLPSPLIWHVIQDAQTVKLRVGPIPGDLDGDGSVGIIDLLTLLAAWGPCPNPPQECPADLDDDGDVGILDLLTLLANWG